MNQNVYGERDRKAIGRRAKLDFLYKGLKKVLRKLVGFDNIVIKKISTYPEIQIESELIEIVNKLAWALPYKKDLSIEVLVNNTLIDYDFSQINDIAYQRVYLDKNITHIKLVNQINPKNDMLFYIKAKELLKTNPFRLYKTEILDKNYFSTVEGELLKSSYYKTNSSEEKYKMDKISFNNYKKMLNENQKKEKAYCFVTGPSFDKYKEFKFEENSFKIICNSIVKNNDFLDYIEKPDVLVFADPVFHFSSCEYATQFRDNVIDVIKKYKCFIVVPRNTVPLLLAHYPMLKDFIIGMKTQKVFNFPTNNRLYVKGSANILTLYMLPIASSISNEINILGADGRNLEEKYFWKHSSSVQYDGLMQTVFETHPSFFRDRDYKDYYEEHCAFLENLIEYGEKNGKKYFSLTKSHIPALSQRHKGKV